MLAAVALLICVEPGERRRANWLHCWPCHLISDRPARGSLLFADGREIPAGASQVEHATGWPAAAICLLRPSCSCQTKQILRLRPPSRAEAAACQRLVSWAVSQ